MKLHTSRLRSEDIRECLERAQQAGKVPADIRFAQLVAGGSHTRRRGYEVQLGTPERYTRKDGLLRKKRGTYLNIREFPYAASTDEFRWFVACVYAQDEDAIWEGYGTRDEFHVATANKYNEGIKVGAVEAIDLTADGIDRERYLACLQGIVSEFNKIRREHQWCWVWVKLATSISPLIVQGERTGGNSWKVRLNAPEPEALLSKEWFTPEGWAKWNADDSDEARMIELRQVYGRLLNLGSGQVDTRGYITMEHVQRIFKTAGLPAYPPDKQWRGYVELRIVDDVVTDDVAVNREQMEAAWKEFAVKVGWQDKPAPVFVQKAARDIRPRDADLVPLLGKPNSTYDPMVMPDGKRLAG